MTSYTCNKIIFFYSNCYFVLKYDVSFTFIIYAAVTIILLFNETRLWRGSYDYIQINGYLFCMQEVMLIHADVIWLSVRNDTDDNILIVFARDQAHLLYQTFSTPEIVLIETEKKERYFCMFSRRSKVKSLI